MEQAERLGVPLDENTQMLIDQSKELGIWKEKGKTANELLLDGIERMIKAIGDLNRAFRGLPDDPFPEAPDYSGVPDNFGFGPPPVVHPPISPGPIYTPTPTPDAPATSTTAASMANWAYGKDEPPTPIVINLDGQQIAMAVVPHVPKSLRRRGVTRSTWP
jgi:hypothetical protein